MTAVDSTRRTFDRWRRIVAWLARLLRPPRHGAQYLPRWRRGRFIAAGGLVIIAAFAIAMYFDKNAITDMRRLPHGLIRAFGAITDFGKSSWFLWPLGVFLLLTASVAGRLSRPASLVLASIATKAMYLYLAIALPGLFTNLVKGLVGRGRPLVGDPFVFNSFDWTYAYASLPSGHAATAFSVAVAFGALWPRARWLWWSYAFVIMASRVVLTKHYPSDVVVGALVGGIGAWFILKYFAIRALGFVIDSAGCIHAMPGPSWQRIKRIARCAVAK